MHQPQAARPVTEHHRREVCAQLEARARSTIRGRQSTIGAGQTRRVIRARLTIRGFKDMDAKGLETYAGTSQRYSQRIVASEAVCLG